MTIFNQSLDAELVGDKWKRIKRIIKEKLTYE